MHEDHQELLDTFAKMSPENRASLLACFRVVYASQENAKQVMRERLGIVPDLMPGGEGYEPRQELGSSLSGY